MLGGIRFMQCCRRNGGRLRKNDGTSSW